MGMRIDTAIEVLNLMQHRGITAWRVRLDMKGEPAGVVYDVPVSDDSFQEADDAELFMVVESNLSTSETIAIAESYQRRKVTRELMHIIAALACRTDAGELVVSADEMSGVSCVINVERDDNGAVKIKAIRLLEASNEK